MAAHVSKVQVSLLDDRISILDTSMADNSPLKQVFRTVSAIIGLVRDEVITDDYSVQLSDYCFGVCEKLKDAIQEMAGDLNESSRTTLENLERTTCDIERVIRTGASRPGIQYDKGKIEEHKLEIEQMLNALSTHRSSLVGERSVDNRAPQSIDVDSRSNAATSVSHSAFRRLLRGKFASDELLSLMKDIFARKDVDDIIRGLPKDDAQTFIDIVDEALTKPNFPLSAHVECLGRLYQTCEYHGLLPKALRIPICYDNTGHPLYRGGFSDVWKGKHCERDVAVKVIRVYSRSELQKVIGRLCREVITWKSLQHPNVLPLIGVEMSEDHFATISDWMINGNINEFLNRNPGANRLGLLGDVARGLIYIHHRGVIHGDLKGANVLIDQTGHARLADFSLLTIADASNVLSQSPYAHGGTMRWMSPELIAPERFGFEICHPTKSSDCYALGMVVYETVSGNVPFHETPDRAVFLKVVDGQRPRREAVFTESLWKIMERCWMSRSIERPSVEDVLLCLEMCSNQQSPPLPGLGKGMEVDHGIDGSCPYREIGTSLNTIPLQEIVLTRSASPSVTTVGQRTAQFWGKIWKVGLSAIRAVYNMWVALRVGKIVSLTFSSMPKLHEWSRLLFRKTDATKKRYVEPLQDRNVHTSVSDGGADDSRPESSSPVQNDRTVQPAQPSNQTGDPSTSSATPPQPTSRVDTASRLSEDTTQAYPEAVDDLTVASTSSKTLLPLEEPEGVQSGDVQPPGSRRGDVVHIRTHSQDSGDGSDATTTFTEEDELEWADAIGELEDEERLIMNGGVGIPIGPDGVPRPLLPPLAPQHAGRKCLVLDLDETLLHSSFKSIQHADYVVPVELEYHWHNVYVIKRPGVDDFLKKMGELFEIVVFTGSLSKYVNPVLDKLDVNRVISHRLFRESCYNHKGNYVKDLSQLGRPMTDIIIVDNSPACYIFHPNNAVPVSSWFNDPHDTELADLCPFLADLRAVDDVRPVLDGGLID